MGSMQAVELDDSYEEVVAQQAVELGGSYEGVVDQLVQAVLDTIPAEGHSGQRGTVLYLWFGLLSHI